MYSSTYIRLSLQYINAKYLLRSFSLLARKILVKYSSVELVGISPTSLDSWIKHNEHDHSILTAISTMTFRFSEIGNSGGCVASLGLSTIPTDRGGERQRSHKTRITQKTDRWMGFMDAETRCLNGLRVETQTHLCHLGCILAIEETFYSNDMQQCVFTLLHIV